MLVKFIEVETPTVGGNIHRLESWAEQKKEEANLAFIASPPDFEHSVISYLGFLRPRSSPRDVCQDKYSPLLLFLPGIPIQQQDKWYCNVIQILNYTLLQEPKSRNKVSDYL